MPRRTSCINCGGAATLLCDYKLGGVHGGFAKVDVPKKMEWAVIDATKMPYRCDVPICQSCATQKGKSWMSHVGQDSIDHCPMHAHMGHYYAWKPIMEDEMYAKRREIAAHYRRKKLTLRQSVNVEA